MQKRKPLAGIAKKALEKVKQAASKRRARKQARKEERLKKQEALRKLKRATSCEGLAKLVRSLYATAKTKRMTAEEFWAERNEKVRSLAAERALLKMGILDPDKIKRIQGLDRRLRDRMKMLEDFGPPITRSDAITEPVLKELVESLGGLTNLNRFNIKTTYFQIVIERRLRKLLQ